MTIGTGFAGRLKLRRVAKARMTARNEIDGDRRCLLGEIDVTWKFLVLDTVEDRESGDGDHVEDSGKCRTE